MKKKITIILILILVVTIISVTAAFAKNNEEQGYNGTIGSMFGAMRNWLEQAQQNGEITENEAQQWEKHFDDMQSFHENNGFRGHCGGFNNDDINENNQNYMPGNMHRGMGGMMRRLPKGSL